MGQRLSNRGIRCDECGYALEGLSGRVCPECGHRFSPAWLYSAEYVWSIRWTLWRVLLAIGCLVAVTVACVWTVAAAGDGYLCVTVFVGGFALLGLARWFLFVR